MEAHDSGSGPLEPSRYPSAPPIHEHVLDLAGQDLTSVPVNVRDRTEITDLRAAFNQLADLPDWFAELTNLRILDLDHNELTVFPRVLLDMPTLRVLTLRDNMIREVPREISRLSNLSFLTLRNNQITALPATVGHLGRLQHLGLRGNRLRTLPADVGRLGGLILLDLRDNPLAIPPELVDIGIVSPRDLINYWEDISKDSAPLNEAKLIVVGEGAVGKTSVIRRLLHNTFDPNEPATRGIELGDWLLDVDAEEIRVNVWDFGGQEIMHATHQFFLTARTVYLLVVDARQSAEQNRIEYWLKMIGALSDSSGTIVVANKCDGGVAEIDIDYSYLTRKYPFISNLHSTSCETGSGLLPLRATILEEIRRVPHLRDRMPTSYFRVKRILESDTSDYMHYSAFEELCRREGLERRTEQSRLSHLLHDLGTVFHYDGKGLDDTYILNPKWVTDGVYAIINSQVGFQKRGVISESDLEDILPRDKFTPGHRGFILKIMKKFELCFTNEEGQYLVPDLLIRTEPDLSWVEATPVLRVFYDVLPPSVMSRLVFRLSPMSRSGWMWRNGILLQLSDCHAVVRADHEDNFLEVSLSSAGYEARRALVEVIVRNLMKIHGDLKGIEADIRLCVPPTFSGTEDVTASVRHLTRLAVLGESVWIPEGSMRRISVIDALRASSLSRQLLSELSDLPQAVHVLVNLDDLPGKGEPPQDRGSIGGKETTWRTPMVSAGVFVVAVVALGLLGLAGVDGLLLSVIGFVGLLLVGLLALMEMRARGDLSERGFLAGLSTVLSSAGSVVRRDKKNNQ